MKRLKTATVTTNDLSSLQWLNSSLVLPREALVVSKAKVEVTEAFFREAQRSAPRKSILVVTGPTCSGKTALVKSVCGHLGLACVQIDELSDVDFNSMWNGGDFLRNACVNSAKFPALSFVKGPSMLVSDQSPFSVCVKKERAIFLDDIECLSDVHLSLLGKTLCALETGLFVVTCADWFEIGRRSRSWRDLKVQDVVALNHLAPTFIQKALNHWGVDHAAIPRELIDFGDLRSCLYHAYLDRQLSIAGTMSTRDSSLTMFHALGRVLYPLKQKDSLWSPFIPDDRALFHSYIHHNFFPFVNNIHEAHTVLEALSLDSYSQSGVPYVEYTLSVLSGQFQRPAARVKPSFTRPEYIASSNKKRTASGPATCLFNQLH